MMRIISPIWAGYIKGKEMELKFYQIVLMVIFCVGMFLVTVPVLLGIGTLLFKLFHLLYRKLIVRKKQKPAVKTEKSEKNKFWFYNVSLPCQIFASLFMMLILWALLFEGITIYEMFVATGSILFLCFLSCSFGYFYLLYQLVYFVCSKIFHSKYHTSWKLWLLVLVWLAMDTYMGYWLVMMLLSWAV